MPRNHTNVPRDFTFRAESITCTEIPSITAAEAAPDGKKALATFTMLAYSGGDLELGWGYPVVIDLAGMRIASKSTPILLQHGYLGGGKTILDAVFGHTKTIANDGKELTASGVVSGVSDDVRKAVDLSKNEFPFQASVGVRGSKVTFIDERTSVKVNGRTITGPRYIVGESLTREISVVVLGADHQTEATIAAQRAAQEGSMSQISTGAGNGLAAAVAAANAPATPVVALQASGEVNASAANGTLTAAAPTAPPRTFTMDEVRAAAIEAGREGARTATRETLQAMRQIDALTKDHPDIRAQALAENWNPEKTELAVLRAGRPSGPAIHARDGFAADTSVIECALAISTRAMPEAKIVAAYGEKAVDAVNRRYRNGISLQRVLLEAAALNGVHEFGINKGNLRDVLRAAFTIQAGVSSLSLPVALGNTMNKVALRAFMSVDQGWRRVCKISRVDDFKTYNSFRLAGDFQYQPLGPGGELKHGELSEASNANKASTQGIIFNITRENIINDDSQVLETLPAQLGRGGGLAVAELGWKTFMNNAAFFTAGRGNRLTGGTSALGVDGLSKAFVALSTMTDEKGKPIAIDGKVLLIVPFALMPLGKQIYTSLHVLGTGANAPDANPWSNTFEPVPSAYLSNASYTGYSTTRWYLTREPTDVACVDMAFLDGVETPTIENVDLDGDTLGVGIRGYHDFGAAQMEWRCGVCSDGA